MTVETKPLAELTSRAIEVLSRELGAADTLRFINQFTTGNGDYTAERDALFGSLTLDEIITQIQCSAPESPAASGPAAAEPPPEGDR